MRQFEIVGEAVKNLSTELTAAEPGTPWRLNAGVRDRLIHAYFSVNLDAIWSMVEQDLAPWKDTVVRLIAMRPGSRQSD